MRRGVTTSTFVGAFFGRVTRAMALAGDAMRANGTDACVATLDACVERLDRALERAGGSGALGAFSSERDEFAKSARACRFRCARAREDALNGGVDVCDAVAARERDVEAFEGTIDFWRELFADASAPARLLMGVVTLALNGAPEGGTYGARALARSVRPSDADEDAELGVEALFRAGDDLVRRASATNFGSGFLAGLGGIMTLPVTIPVQLAATTFTSLRLAFAIAILAGKSPLEPQTAARAIQVALGAITNDEDAASVKTASEREGVRHAAFRGAGTAAQAASYRLMRVFGTKLAQRGAQRGASMAVTRAVPIIGGVIGGTVDGVLTRMVGARAMEAFFPTRPKSTGGASALVNETAEQAMSNVKIAAESAASALNDAFGSISMSFKSFSRRDDGQADGGSETIGTAYQSSELEDDAWERFERELELESMRAVLEDEREHSSFHATSYETERKIKPVDKPVDAAKEIERERRREKKDDAWAEHHARWKVFVEDHSNVADCVVRYKDIPWPPSTSRLLLGYAGRDASDADVRDAWRKLLLRWHPDRFSRYRFDATDASKINEKLSTISSAIKDQYTSHLASLRRASEP